MHDGTADVERAAARTRAGARVVRPRGVGLFVRDEMADLQPGDRDPGEQSPVLLLHGLGLDHQLWDAVADRLIRYGHRVIRPDMRGHGRSEAPTAGYGLDELVGDAASVLDALEIDGAHVVGHSLGGTVGLQLALGAPERVRSLTTLGALVAGQTPPQSFLAWAGELFELLPQGLPALLHALPDTAPYRHRLTDPELAAEVRRVVGSSLHAAAFIPDNFTDIQAVSTATPTPWDRVRAGELKTRLLTIDGSEDPVVSGVLESTRDAVPAARGVVLPGAGHLALVEQPVTVAHHVTQFVRAADAWAVRPGMGA